MSQGWYVVGTAVTGMNLPDSGAFKGYDLDLGSPESIARFADALSAKQIRIDFLMNNAGVCTDEFSDHVDMQRLRETFEVNFFGLIGLTESLLPLISDHGQIFNMSSTAGMLSKDLDLSKRYPAYKMSKTAVNMYTRTLAARLMSKGQFVASVHPGWVKTDMGGGEADLSPDEAASQIYEFAVKEKPISDTGLFWFKGERLDW
jgi:NAD(P)-dependent dehydrogenase (short-subunit alcohol dehydrogenase family)